MNKRKLQKRLYNNHLITWSLNHLITCINLEQKRKCIACGEIKPKSDLIKITKEYSSGDVVVQPNSKTFGRSVYLCYNRDCINMAFKKNKINKMLKTNTNIDKEMLDYVWHTNKK